MAPKKKEEDPIEGSSVGQRGDLSRWTQDIFNSFKNARRPWEEMWIECWYNYLGKYQSDLNWRPSTEGEAGNSRIFIKASTIKCNTAHAKIMDMGFGANAGEEVPFEVDAIRTTLHDYEEVTEEQLKAGTLKLKNRIRSHNKGIHLMENIDTGALEMAILGTGVIKGPIIDFVEVKTFEPRVFGGTPISHFDPSINPHSLKKDQIPLPTFKHIPLWSYYCDPNAETNRKSIMEMHFDRLLPSEFLALGKMGGYRKGVIREVMNQATTDRSATDDFKYVQLAENYMGEEGDKDKKISVLEAWGLVRAGDLRAAATDEYPVDVPSEYEDEDLVEALVVLAGDGAVIKACMNPMGKRVFNVCPYKKVPGCIYGNGVAWAMRDSQKMLNSIYRMIIDNKALTGPGMLAVNLDKINTKRTKDMKIYPKKVWYLKGGATPKDAIDMLKFTDVTRDLKELAMDMDRFADEETGIPKLEQGQQASWLNKTMGGMAMLMRRTDVNIRPVIKNIDDYWIEPIIEAEAEWFFFMDPDPELRIPHKIRATGTSSLIANELKMEAYAKFMEITLKSPQLSMFIDNVKMVKNWARMLDTTDIVRSEEEIKQIMDEMQKRGNEPKDIREFLAIDKLFPLMSVAEQDQILALIGIQPDSAGRLTEHNLKLQGASADIEETKAKTAEKLASARKQHAEADAPPEGTSQE